MSNQTHYANQYEYTSFIKNALTFKGSVTPRVFKKVFYIFAYACLVSLIHYYVQSFSIPIGPFEYAGLMLGLILVFRINNGYDRWWEARKIWGSIVNSSCNLAIIVNNYIASNNSDRAAKITSYLIAMPYLIKNRLRNDNSIAEISKIIDPICRDYLLSKKNYPLILSSIIANELLQAKNNNELDSFAFLKAEEQRALLIDCLGACERILKTPIPFVMAVKARRFILIFLLALPLALIDISVLIAPLITALVAYAIFSIDQIGYELQAPFSLNSLSHLPLDEICHSIKNNIIDVERSGENGVKHFHVV